MEQNENGQARLGGFPLAIGPLFSNPLSPLNATGSWTAGNPSYPFVGEDPDSLLASDSVTSARSKSHSHRLSRNCQNSVATIEQSQTRFFTDGADDDPWNQEQASMEERTLFEGRTLFAETPRPLSLNEIIALSPNEVSSALARAKKKRFANFMSAFRAWTEQYRNENVKAAAETPSTQSTNQSTQNSSQTSRRKRKQKSRDRESSPPEDSQEKRNKGHPTSGRSGDECDRLACPFHQHDRMMHKTHTSRPIACWGKGFKNIARLKEHLRRDHALLLRCIRCWLKMKTIEAMSAHEGTECEESSWQLNDWIAEEQMRRIENHGITWDAIFEILFEGVPVPSRYHEVDLTINGMIYVPNSRRQADSETFHRLESNARFVATLESLYSRIMERYDPEILRKLPTIAQMSQSIVAQDPLPENIGEAPRIPLPTPSLHSWPLDNTELSQSTHGTENTYAHSYLESNIPDQGMCACSFPYGTGSNCENCKGLRLLDSPYDFEN